MSTNVQDMHVAVEIISDDTLRSAWSTYHRTDCIVHYKDGTRLEHGREFIRRDDAAAVLAYTAAPTKVLLTKQFRLPVFMNRPTDASMIEVCGGMLASHEPEIAAQREAEEELGYRLSNLEFVFSGYPSPGSVTEKIYCYIAEYDTTGKISRGGGVAEEGEKVEILEYPLNDAIGLIQAGAIRDLRTIALLYFLKSQVRE
ncbi:NUDIX domain-containing protein [Terriglobus albidus]|uniref:NUDIX domain-containing protein n=1 Tax=Terriglobus albidus TaxID=1592106 RepID=UPI0021E008C6|nr:NUDIX domain-containing protein [Terriglobus albidus]